MSGGMNSYGQSPCSIDNTVNLPMSNYRRVQKCLPNTVIIDDNNHSCSCLDKASRLRLKLNHVVLKPQQLDVLASHVYGSEFCTPKTFCIFPETAES